MNLFLELRRHGRLADKRHPMYEKSRFTRFWMYFMAVFWAGYLIFIGTTFAFGFEGAAVEPYHLLNSGLVFVLALDFLMRFPFQKTPTQEVKPYLLLPVRRNRLIDFLLIRSGLSGFNLLWLFLFAPFALITVTKFYGLWGVLTYCVGIWLLMVLNNYWFLLCKTLLSERIWWVLLPVAVYGGLALGMFLPDDSPVFDWFLELGEGFITGNAWVFLALLAGIGLMWWVNSRVIRRLIYEELNKTEDTTVEVKTLSEYRFLDRYGMTGEYMRLELKLMLRNKMCRKSLIAIVCAVAAISAVIAFTDVYSSGGMNNFWVMYNYVIVSLLAFSTLMGYEGNYMDGLMTRRESIFALLRAKYVLYNLVLLLPFLLMLTGVVTGKLTLLQILGWGLFTAGPVNFGFFQLAVYNNRTVDLNAKMTSRNNAGTGLQQLASFGAFMLPWIIYLPLVVLFNETVAYWGLLVLGLAFILTSRLWIRNVYTRLMKRRYKNMEGFRDSRQR